MCEKKTIGILGGMGPLATADLFQKITLLTEAETDRDHIRVYIDSNANIPDRTAAILSNGPDPVPEMASALRNLEACGADCVIMPCNTAHYFLPRLQAMTEIPFLSILTAAAEACKTRFPGKTVGILATKGTLSAQLYQNALGEAGVPYLTPETEEQDALMRVIYDGVKAGKGPDAYRADLLTRGGAYDDPWGRCVPAGLHGTALGCGGRGPDGPRGGSHCGACKSRHPFLRLPCTGKISKKRP